RCPIIFLFSSRSLDGDLSLAGLPLSFFHIFLGKALLNQDFNCILQMDVVFNHMPVASMVSTVFASIYVSLDGQLFWIPNVYLLEIST
ncbi:hypothetical protein A2U01_0079181, partial [Trifolium medium]|nr:hypothetical protein [Trifolium medium]